jgi:hypothetical protein
MYCIIIRSVYADNQRLDLSLFGKFSMSRSTLSLWSKVLSNLHCFWHPQLKLRVPTILAPISRAVPSRDTFAAIRLFESLRTFENLGLQIAQRELLI